jgi:hypothetical protein
MKNTDFLTEFERVKKSIESGTTPVFNEIRNAKTTLLELPPYLIIQSILLIVSTIIIQSVEMSGLYSMVVLLVVNTTSQTLSNVALVGLKHFLRVKKLRRYGIAVNERNISVLESMEYQSV